jgi:tripartite-type tricarboxylate transporter receptor subunit TctC
MRRRRIRRAHTARHTNRKSHTADSGLSCKGRLVSLDQLSAPSSAIESLARARDGRVRVLGIGSTARMPELPDTPSIGELVPGFVMTNWYGLFGPRGLSPHVLARLGAEIAKARDDPTRVQRTAADGLTMILTPPEAPRAKMEAEVPRWKKLLPELGIKAERCLLP